MENETNEILQNFLQQTGENGGELELVQPTLEKSGVTLLRSIKLDKRKDHGKDKHVVILGAGIAGLTLAHELLTLLLGL